jgi:hypothetical protein
LTLLSWAPLFFLDIVDPCARKVLIGHTVRFWIFPVGFKPSSKTCNFGTTSLQNLVNIILCIEVDGLFIFKMDRQTINSRRLYMHTKFHDMPAALNRSNVTCIKIFLDLISILIKNLHCGSVMAFVYILVDILDCLDRRTDFDIDVTIVSGK